MAEQEPVVYGEDVFDELVSGTKYDYEADKAAEAGIAEAISGADSTPPIAGEDKGMKLKKAKGVDMATTKAFELRADSTEVIVRPATREEGKFVEKIETFERTGVAPTSSPEKSPAESDMVEKILNDAQKRMLAELNEDIAATVVVHYKTNEWWIRILSFDEQLAVGMEVSRELKSKPKLVGPEGKTSDSGSLNLEEDGVWNAVAAAMLHICCISGEMDMTPVFLSYADARRLVEKRGKAGLALSLFNGIITANPDLLKNLITG